MLMKSCFAVLLATALAVVTPTIGRAQFVVSVPSGDMSHELHFPSDPLGAIAHARGLVAAGNMPAAITWLSRYVALHPREIDPSRFLGDLYFRNGEIPQAIEAYLRIERLDPSDPETHDRLGVAYATQHRVDDAIAEFTKSLPSADAIPDLVTLHRVRGDFVAFREDIEHRAAEDGANAPMQMQLGELDLADNRPADAIIAFSRALRDRTNDPIAENGLGRAYLQARNFSGAVVQFQTCIGLHPTFHPCWTNLGAAYLHLHEYGLAKVALARAQEINPEAPAALVNLGYLADEQGSWKNAVTLYAKAIAYGPYTSEAYIDVGLDYIGHNLFQQAEAALTKGIAFNPYDGRIHVLLGDVYKAQGQTSLATSQYQLAVRSDSDLARSVAQDRLSHLPVGGTSAPP